MTKKSYTAEDYKQDKKAVQRIKNKACRAIHDSNYFDASYSKIRKKT